jgi:hypothetical protein
VKELRADQLHALERMFILLAHLVYRQPPQLASSFTQQLCEVLQRDGTYLLKHLIGLGKRKARVVADTLAILAQISRLHPQHVNLLKEIMLGRSPLS